MHGSMHLPGLLSKLIALYQKNNLIDFEFSRRIKFGITEPAREEAQGQSFIVIVFDAFVDFIHDDFILF